MNESTLLVLCVTAVSIGFIHTLIGPDHYLPFIVMSKARGWNLRKTMWLTFACGLGHVLSSVVLGLLGALLGVALGKLEAVESARGYYAAQAMMIFGFTYCVWGIWRAIKNKPHTHTHLHEESRPHAHEHVHTHVHTHVHESAGKSITPWVLFTIFVLGPCEPLIPMLMVPAAQHSLSGTVLVAAVFSVVTVATMMSIVLVSAWGVSFIRLGKIERFSHAMAGGAILASGMAIQFLGL
jgi:sulfite exporter TauE/SafE